MIAQQLIVLLLVAVAATYLGRNLWRAWRNFRDPDKGGCASGCGKCAYAVDPSERRRRKTMAVINANERK